MSIDEVRRCDVFRTIRGVNDYQLSIVEVLERDDHGAVERYKMVSFFDVDLGPRGLARALRLLEKAVKPPTKKPKGTIQ